MIRFEFVARVG